ncbi:MAG: lysylphosphatidylglycerol synthase domain-containing protein, partial [Devosia sp.]
LLVLGAGLVIGAKLPGGMALPDLPSTGALTILALMVLVAGLVVRVAARKVRFLSTFPQALRQALFSGARLPVQAGLSLLIVAANLASFSCAALATGTTLGIEGILILVPLILSAMLIPASVAGWGFREGAAAALFPLIGASASAGFAASLVFGLVILAGSLPGALFVIKLKKIL